MVVIVSALAQQKNPGHLIQRMAMKLAPATSSPVWAIASIYKQGNLELQPQLAKELPKVSKDGLKYNPSA